MEKCKYRWTEKHNRKKKERHGEERLKERIEFRSFIYVDD